MSKKDEITKLYFVDRENPATIAKKLNISKSAVTQVLQKDDRYKKEKEVRKKQNKIRINNLKLNTMKKLKKLLKKQEKLNNLKIDQKI